jgi:hypothetical protein
MSNKKAKTKEITEEAILAVDDQADFAVAPVPETEVVEAIEPEAPVAEAPVADFRMVSNSLGELTVDGRMYRVTREGRTFLCGSTSARTVEDLAAKLKAKQ